MRPEPPEEGRKRLGKLLSRSNKAMCDGIQLSEALVRGSRHLSSRLLDGPRRYRVETNRLALCERSDTGMAEDQEPELSAQLDALISNAQLDRFIAELGRHPLAEGEVREVDGMRLLRHVVSVGYFDKDG